LNNADELWKSAYDKEIEELQDKYWLMKLEEICSLITDWSHFSPKTTAQWYPYITVKDIDDDWILDLENSKKISKEDFDILVKNWCQPKKWDVLYSKDWTIWKIHLVENNDFVVLSSLAIIRPWNKVTSDYLYQIFHSNFFEKQAVWSKTWAAIKRIVLKTIKSLEIPVPPLSEQEKIVKHLDKVSQEVKKLKSYYQSQLDNLKELKKSILDKAFKWELIHE
jgi:type I restriction enzyme S subunit